MLRSTIKQVAKACGVSVATVSKALNNAPDIATETAERIRSTAKEMGYAPNAAARTLKQGRSHNIGVILESADLSALSHEYFAGILSCFRDTVEQRGYDITFMNPALGTDGMTYLEHARYRSFDGIFLEYAFADNPELQELLASDIPLVTVDRQMGERGFILSDSEKGVCDLVRCAYNKGHRNIAYVSAGDDEISETRRNAFYKTCQELSLSVPDGFVVSSYYHDTLSASCATRALLELPNRPTCILYPDDISAMGGLNELKLQGLSVPNDMSIAGFDGFTLSNLTTPRLTTVRQDAETVGREAALQLLEAIETPETYQPECKVVSTVLWEGETIKSI